MTQPAAASTAPVNGSASAKPKVGPHPGFISSSNQYSSETRIRRMFRNNGCDPAREDNYRLQGVQLIENVREHLKLPVRTFDTACIYFHKFRLNFRDAEYNCQDAALASLFVACKVEDTIKKSKDILAAAYAVKNPDKPAPTDDKMFDQNGKIIIGLERLILETIGFDFRTRYPQKLLVKIVRSILGASNEAARAFYATAYAMCIDMYKTFVPVKRTTFSMAMAVVELTARLTDSSSSSSNDGGGGGGELLSRVDAFAAQRRQYARAPVMETMLDLLDLYVQHHKATKLGARFDLARFIDIKIQLNKDLDASYASRYLFHCQKCEIDAPAPAAATTTTTTPTTTTTTTITTTTTTLATTTAAWPGGDSSMRRSARGQDGTMRFVFDPEAAKTEQDAVAVHFNEEYEEYEVEVEEPVPPPPPPPEQPRGPRDGREGGGGGRGPGGGHGGGRGGGYRGGGHRGRGDRKGEPYGGHRGGDRYQRGRNRHH